MLKLTRKVEYGLIALRHMKTKDEQSVTSAKEVAETYAIPTHLLAKVLQQMAREGIVEPVHGPNGGYRLKSTLGDIKLTHFIEILEGPLGLVNCSIEEDCNQLEHCNIRHPINRINNSIITMFDKLTLAEITQG